MKKVAKNEKSCFCIQGKETQKTKRRSLKKQQAVKKIQRSRTMKKNNQMFRFCLNCVRMSLIQKGQCFFCKGKFILKGIKDDLFIRKKEYEKTY